MFSAKSIADAPPHLRQAMEQVAGRAETLAKSKMSQEVPPPFRKRSTKSVRDLDWDPKTYTEGGKESRDERNKKRTIRVFGMEQLGVDEYQKLMREIDSMTGSAELDRIVRKRVQEVKERLETERLAREANERRQTRCQTEVAGTSTEPAAPVPAVGSPRKRKRQDETRNETGGKAPKKPEPKQKKAKTSETSERKQTAGKRPKTTASTMTSSKTTRIPQHVDDDEYDLDVRTGKFVRKEKKTRTQEDDEVNGSKKNINKYYHKDRRHRRRVEGS